MLFIGYDSSRKLGVVYSFSDDKILPTNTMRSLKGVKHNKGMFINYKKTVFYVLLSDESSEFDKAFQNKIVKLRVYYTSIFLANLSMTLIAELDLSPLVNLAKLQILGVKSLEEEKSLLIELSPVHDSNGNPVQTVKFFEQFKADML